MTHKPGLTSRSPHHFFTAFGITASILLAYLGVALSADWIDADHVLLRTERVDIEIVAKDEYLHPCGDEGDYEDWLWTVEWTHSTGETVRGRMELCNADSRMDEFTSAWVSDVDQRAAFAGEEPIVVSYSMATMYLLGVACAAVFGIGNVAGYAWGGFGSGRRTSRGRAPTGRRRLGSSAPRRCRTNVVSRVAARIRRSPVRHLPEPIRVRLCG